ncbi:mannose-6-phosphate isomerase, class I [Rathayibacter rathayi]|uniref:mannose-6-phosphate isomerase n=1 Tax=Rathayibacter rathayi TaxID=33887 RepID=A0ABD6WB22_RATRA|nr:mannose-6-phosphate isomerase, class I [Rathayibacter rathayi]AZZ49334.1 mannose-6-phosphate isomerase, class I [Rathayibacter rathayi]MWV73425.1 mannose-6-phosphate isomerase, class I [Rathayibacter rathayi NCPPB 2980 = VKM Ac-1601]PPF15018.1 mannose-6-phosphate isomerase, class I [Rathayibacter rathayi]PPF50311.1 mannose-6-phosphate isomerase, class I [Rathayibacter rathayi]PPF81186.1 mannose-6-phosphate isomerase, class I [Rathayibacter rathayi]
MFIPIGNTPRDYAWGSLTGISEALGTVPSGGPEAELWLGAHPGSPARILDPSSVGAATLAEWIAKEPAATLAGVEGSVDPVSGAPRLPFLLKILAAGGPLSLQAHPSAETARRRFVEEEEAGIARDAAERNYKDPFHKPELIYALSENFDALCGFREPAQARALLVELADRAPGQESAAIIRFADTLEGEPAAVLRRAVSWLLVDGDRAEVASLVAAVVGACAGEDRLETTTVGELAESYPGDPGIVLSLLLNRVRLARGEVLYLPAGNIHAYLAGTGVELMAASDNVLRGGLTPKHIDVPELVSVLEFSPLPVPYLPAELAGPGVRIYRPDVPDFVLAVVQPESEQTARVALRGPAIALATEGSFSLAGAEGSVRVARGASVFVTPSEGDLAVTGRGTLFVATV